MRRIVALLAATALAGCGSASTSDLPAPAQPDRSPALATAPRGTVTPMSREAAESAATPHRTAMLRGNSLRVVLDPQARTLTLIDAVGGAVRTTIPVGVGPTQLVCNAQGPCFVTDTTGDALLVVRVSPDGEQLRLTRRVYLAGAPYAIAVDPQRRRLWVTLTARNELAELGAHGRPHVLSRRPTVRQPDGVWVSPKSGDVIVTGLVPPQDQRLTDPASPDRP